MTTLQQLGRQLANVRVLRVERRRFCEADLGILEPTLGDCHSRGNDTPIDNALPDPLLEGGMAFRRQIALDRSHGRRDVQERFRSKRSRSVPFIDTQP